MKVIKGGVTAARGFLAAGIHCGLKYKNKDLALLYSEVPCAACGLFTQNKVQAAPLKVTQAHLKDARTQAVVINSGNANCCTGLAGLADARQTCQAAAKSLDLKSEDVLVASTGIIGRRLPVEKIKKAMGPLACSLSREGSLSAAQAILTTDTHPKQIAVEINLGQTKARIGAMAKGAGMIEPHLATMLAFITTDVVIDERRLKAALQEAADNSFNLITVEGDTSTNDLVLILANGLAGNKQMNAQEFKVFQQALNWVSLSLAQMIIRDAEGATKFVRVQVEGAKNLIQAKRVAFKVANSPLVKTALFGQDPNWGRIAAAVGCAEPAVQQDKLSIYLGPVKVLSHGSGLTVNQSRLRQLFKKAEIAIKISLGLGRAKTEVFTCDLSHKYVKINAEY